MTDYADGENAARLWPRGVLSVSELIGGRTYFELPRDPRPTLPCLVVGYATNRLDDHGFTVVNLTYEAYGVNKKAASDLAFIVAAAMKDFRGLKNITDAQCTVIGADCDAVHQVPGSEWAKKYAVTGWLMLRKLT